MLLARSSLAAACAETKRALGDACLKSEDCLSGICSQLVCAAAPPTTDTRRTTRDASGAPETAGGGADGGARRSDRGRRRAGDVGRRSRSVGLRARRRGRLSAVRARRDARRTPPGRLRRHRRSTAGRRRAARAPSRRRCAGAVLALDPRASRLRGTSRTDAGVHAEGQLVAFDTERDIPPRGWTLGAQPAPARRRRRARGARRRRPASLRASRRAASAIVIACSSTASAIRAGARARGAWPDVDPAAMAREAQAAPRHARLRGLPLGGRRARDHGAHADAASTSSARPTRASSRVVVEGDAFLYNMVRILVGHARRRRREGGSPRAPSRARSRRATGASRARPRRRTAWCSSASTCELPEGAGEPWPP